MNKAKVKKVSFIRSKRFSRIMNLAFVYHQLRDTKDLGLLVEGRIKSRRESLIERKEDGMLKVEEWIDSLAERYLSKVLRGNNYSRLESLFAWPCLEEATLELMRDTPIPKESIAVFEVDSGKCIVVDYDHIAPVLQYDQRESMVQHYWEKAKLLKDFLRDYKHQYYREFGLKNAWINRHDSSVLTGRQEVIVPIHSIKG